MSGVTAPQTSRMVRGVARGSGERRSPCMVSDTAADPALPHRERPRLWTSDVACINEGVTLMKRSVWYLPLLGLALLALPRPSAAGDHGKGWDYKTLPGAACQP